MNKLTKLKIVVNILLLLFFAWNIYSIVRNLISLPQLIDGYNYWKDRPELLPSESHMTLYIKEFISIFFSLLFSLLQILFDICIFIFLNFKDLKIISGSIIEDTKQHREATAQARKTKKQERLQAEIRKKQEQLEELSNE